MRVKFSLFIILLLILNACDRPSCTSNNPVFNNNSPESSIYKIELEKQLQTIDTGDLRYWLKAYIEKDGEEYLLVNLQNESLCAVMQLNVTNWNKLEDIRKRKGIGRRGAELDELTFTIEKKEESVDFVYENLSRIID